MAGRAVRPTNWQTLRSASLHNKHMMTSQKMSALAPVVLRLAMTAVFIWFGVSQLINTSAWVSLVPGWATGILGLTAADVVHMNGVFEIIAGCMLGLGIYVRV